VLVSEPFANRFKLPKQGGILRLYTDKGEMPFPIAGIYYDYASTQGTILMALPVYQQYWNDQAITALGLRLEPGVDPDGIVMDLQKTLVAYQQLNIRDNRGLRQEVLAVFDRTFTITGALQILAMIVAFIGVLSALLSLEMQQQQELGILRSIGLTLRDLWKLVMIESGLMGAASGILATPIGYVLAILLVYILNKRSFGWTLQLDLAWLPFFEAWLVAVSSALLAGVYPAIHVSRMVIADAIRSE
jgi:putative ABC transport system permease protein